MSGLIGVVSLSFTSYTHATARTQWIELLLKMLAKQNYSDSAEGMLLVFSLI